MLDESIALRVVLSVSRCSDGWAARAADICAWLRLAPLCKAAKARAEHMRLMVSDHMRVRVEVKAEAEGDG